MKQSQRAREEREEEFLQLEEEVKNERQSAGRAAQQQRAAQQILQFLRGKEEVDKLQGQVEALRKEEAALGSDTGVVAQMQRIDAEKRQVNQAIYEGKGQTSVHGQQLEGARALSPQ